MTPTTPSPISDQAAELAALGELIRTQNNRITDQPLFAVQKRNRVYGIDTDYDPKIHWVNSDHDEVDADKAAELEAAYQEDGDDRPGDYKRLGYHEYWEFVTACFTEQGCKDYLARNGHNLGETRIYAYGTYRNAEWQFVRKFLMNQHALSTAPTTGSAPTVYLRQSSEFGPWLETGKDDPFAVAFVAASPAASGGKDE